MDDSLRSPFGPPLRAFNAQALLSGLRRDDDKGIKRLLKWIPACAGMTVTLDRGMRRDDGALKVLDRGVRRDDGVLKTLDPRHSPG